MYSYSRNQYKKENKYLKTNNQSKTSLSSLSKITQNATHHPSPHIRLKSLPNLHLTLKKILQLLLSHDRLIS